MRVKELIEVLKQFDSEKEIAVGIHLPEDGFKYMEKNLAGEVIEVYMHPLSKDTVVLIY